MSASGVAPSFLFVTQYFPPERGAAQVRLGAVTREVHSRGHRVDVVTSIPNYPTGRFFPGWSRRPLQRANEDGIEVTRVWVWPAIGSGLGRLANFLSFGATSVLGMARSPRADWTVVEYPTLFGALPAVLWCRIARRQVVVNVADLWVDASVALGVLPDGALVAVLRRLERWMLRSADVVNAVTEGLRDELVVKGVDPDRIAWLPNGADTEMFKPGEPDEADVAAVDLAPGEQLIVYAGTHGYVHGLEVVLEAAELLRDVPVRFLLVGGGSEKAQLCADAAARGLDQVVFWDPVAPERVASLLKLAVAGLACTRKGDLYRSVRSAKMFPVLASAKPVLYSGDDEGAAMVAAVGAGWATPAGDAAALAAAVRDLLASPDEAAERGRRGREHVVATSSWKVVVGSWLAHLETWRRTGTGSR
jgi:glycosyltransferase involved in cell wall biosynthesis